MGFFHFLFGFKHSGVVAEKAAITGESGVVAEGAGITGDINVVAEEASISLVTVMWW